MPYTSAELRIAGFGPRLMGGHRHEPGILPVACNLIEKRLHIAARLTNIALNFLSLLPHENLSELVFKSNADYVVFESVPIEALHQIGIVRSRLRPYLGRLVLFWDLFVRGFSSLIEYIGGDPLAPMLDYLAAVTLIAAACKSVGVRAVVLLPITRGLRYSAKSVMAYRSALRQLAKVQGIILVDCSEALKALPKSSILQHDLGCLPRMHQEAIGQVISDSVVADILSRSRRFDPLISLTTVKSNQPALKARATRRL